MKDIESIFKALADQNRLRILALLGYKKMCVCELAHILGITQPSVSRHLKKLKSSGLITDEQDSFWTNYMTAKPLSHYLQIILEQLKTEDIYLSDLKKLKKADRTNLCCTGQKK